MKYYQKFQRFMYGRYGVDELYRFLFRLYLLLIIVDLFVNSRVLTILELVIVGILFFRFFSKDIGRRRKENKVYLGFKKSLFRPFKVMKRNYMDRHDYLYKKCSCKTTLKLPLPSRRGISHAKCPKCGKKVTIFSLRKQVVEVIRGKEKVRV